MHVAISPHHLRRVGETALIMGVMAAIFSTALLLLGVYVAVCSWLLWRIAEKMKLLLDTP
jgi:hypothetical protein